MRLSVSINDNRYNNSNGVEPTQAIGAAEYYLDMPPWQRGSVAQAMSASDGSFHTSIEAVRATLDTSSWRSGKHIVYARGRDSANNWGAFSAAFVTIDPAAFEVTSIERSLDNGQIVSRLWSFGDGQSSSETNPVHEYAVDASYTVQLSVSDDEGKSASVSKTVTVAAESTPVLSNGQMLSGLSAATNNWRSFRIKLPTGRGQLLVNTSGGSGVVAFYVQYGQAPDGNNNVCAKEGNCNTESCLFEQPTGRLRPHRPVRLCRLQRRNAQSQLHPVKAEVLSRCLPSLRLWTL